LIKRNIVPPQTPLPFFLPKIIFFFILLKFQIIVGILFLIIGGMNINDEVKVKTAEILNDVITILVFLITVINVVINSFGMRSTDADVAAKIK
jgi:hypothetical protein